VRRLWGYLTRHRANLALAIIAAIVGSAGQSVVPLISRQIVDGVIIDKTSALWPWLLLLLATSVVTFGFAYIRRYRGGQLALAVQYDLRNDMHDRLQRLDLDTLSRLPTGQLVARANSDSTLVQGLLSFLPLLSGNLLMMVASLAIMFFLAPLLALLALVVVPALFAVSYRMRQRVFPATWDGQQREGDVAQIVDEGVNGVRVVKAFGQEARELNRVVSAARRLYGARMRAVRLQARFQPVLEAVPVLAQVAILALGGWMTLQGQISIGTFLAFSTYVGQFAAPARQLAGVLTVGQQARAGVERIFQLLDLPSAITDPPNPVPIGRIRGEISFEGVDFAYPDGSPVLRGLDLQIAAGERVALIGASGSGKSTVTALLSRFHDPDAGTVRVDGHDLRTLALAELRGQIGSAFEESFLFSATVRENIAYGRPDASATEVEAAARAAAAHDFILELPDGYDTTVGERGLSLSGGQRQRVALARAILTDPRILVLDDATSAVDARTEVQIHDALREILPGRTTVLVAHRVSTLHLADRVVVLDHGRVVDDGRHEDLIERSAAYRELLSGLDAEQIAQLGDSVEAFAAIADGTTAAAWVRDEGQASAARSKVKAVGGQSLGAGLGPGGGGSWRMALTATPQLLARVGDLPPIRDSATVDLARETRVDPQFSLLRLLTEFRRPLLVGLLLVVLDAIAGLVGPVMVKTGIDDGVAKGVSSTLWLASAVFLVVALADLVDGVFSTFVTGRTAERIMLSLRVRIWAQLQRLSLDYYEREMSGRIMTRMTTDVDQFESLIENGLLAALVSFVTFAGVGVALLVMNLELGLYTLAVVVPLAAATVVFRRRSAALYDQARERIAIVNADFQESLSGVREAQAFVHEAATVERFHRLGRDYLRSRVAAQRLVALYFPFVQFLNAVADAVVLGVGASLIDHGHLTAGALIAFLLYVDMFFSPIQQLSQVFDSWQQTRVSVNRIADLMRLSTLTPEPAQPADIGVVHGELTLDRVRFAYPGVLTANRQRPPEALHDISLRISAGETVALVGETGAGKSTVMKLIARFYDPDAGVVRVDRHDLRSLSLADYRHALGYVPQESFLFTGSIRDNIAYGRPDVSDADVEAAARAVGAHEFIAGLPGGYLHEVAERGRSLSAGQRQLIALARAELVDPAILLLDEATSNLDLASEARVSAAVERLAHARTTVVIAHRLQTARGADRIIVLDQGRVVETGPHEELIAAGGRYAAMWQAFELVGPAARD
jgi:ATP-binding cassette subfamily B protein